MSSKAIGRRCWSMRPTRSWRRRRVARRLNSGHRKGGRWCAPWATTTSHARSRTYAAVAIAIIGNLPDTLADRSMTVDLKRRMPSEKVASFRFDRVGHLDVLARKAARWAQDHAGTIAAADPEMPRHPQPRSRQLGAIARHRRRGRWGMA